MNRSIKIMVLPVLWLCVHGLLATPWRHGFGVETGFEQEKERATYGLVFEGLAGGLDYNSFRQINKMIVDYDLRVRAAYLEAEDIFGLALHAQPAKLALMRRYEWSGMTADAGMAARLDYRLQYYPDLQLGADYWLTDYMLGVNAQFKASVPQAEVSLKLYSAVAGVVSRNPAEHNPYFYDLEVGHVISDMHHDFHWRDLRTFNDTRIEVIIAPVWLKGVSVGYVMECCNYNKAPGYHALEQYLRIGVGGGR